ERLYDTNRSESLSSLDSLELEEPVQNRERSTASSFFAPHPERGHSGRKTIENGRRQPPDGSGETIPRAEDRRSCVGLQERSKNTEALPPRGQCALLSLCETIAAADVEHDEVHSDLDSPKQDNVTTVTTNDDVTPGVFFLEREKPPDLGQRGDRDTTAKPPLPTDFFFPGKNLAKPHEAAREPNFVPSDNRKSYAPRQMMKDDSRHAPVEKNWIRDSVNDLNKFSNDMPKAERFKDTRSLRQESSSNLPSDSSRHRESLADTANADGISSHAPATTVHQVRFVKGILKKQSRYTAADRGPLCGLGKLVSAKQVAISIRDSMELARERSRNPEGGATKAVRKRLRWLDEADLRHQDYDTTTAAAATAGVWKPDQTRDTSGLQDNSRFHTRPPELQRGPTTAAISRASSRAAGLSTTTTTTTTPSGASSSSSASHLTMQAWADVGGQAGVREVTGTPRRPNPPSRPAGPQAPRKERPGRASAAPVSWRVRKGTLVRPQPATEASWGGGRGPGKGRALVPRPPPPRGAEATAAPRGVTGRALYCAERTFKPTPPLGDQAPRGPGRTGDVPSHTHTIIRADGDILVTPLPRSFRLSFVEGPPPQALRQEARGGSARGAAAGAQERGLCLHCTPTEEEILLLWQGVRSALAPTEGN
ncbi:hypothetical protein CRUP_033391, partial [Coryphaenoides rupestris]